MRGSKECAAMSRISLALFAFSLVVGTSIPAQQRSGPSNPAPGGSSQEMTSDPTVGPMERSEVQGDVQMARKMYWEGIASYREALAQEPKSAELLNKLGIAY